MPNSIAYLVLAMWPLVMFVLFKRLPVGRALIWSFLGGYLLLPPFPTAFDFPLMPPISKQTLPNLVAVVMVIFVARKRIEIWPDSKIMRGLILAFVFGPIFTVLTNGEPILFAAYGLRGLYAQDIVALIITQSIVLLNFLLARQFLRTREDLRDLLIALLIGGLVYAWPMLLEVRLSPQLNIWIYGYFPHVFEQSIRGGGYRAIVFLSHGIWAAMFIMMALTAALILWRTEAKRKQLFLIAAIFLTIVLVLNKTLGPVLYAVVVFGFIVFANWRMQARVAVLLGALVLIYPLAKTADLVPEDRILSLASTVSEERSNSLRFRFDNENILLERALEKPIFGWGTWGRNHIHDPITGRILSISDGRWVITMGVYGLVGLLAELGLLLCPIFLLYREAMRSQRFESQRLHEQVSSDIPVKKRATERLERYVPFPAAGALALLLALNVVDLIPNATLTPLTWLIAGCLLGYSETIARRSNPKEAERQHVLAASTKRIETPKERRSIL
jgi:hypothetical protein